ncbi:hypothetical protein DTW90_26295 [Neorhizobium sp. P12A]|uniref:FAD/NAD(P)-binding protein n=1 Tax=Neorhizobium sp. P12A TaxID=2268027 RepID=UPI0011EDA87E|nr:FAD/NAD(P)-binding protein [Neorhizobium sp. P12A]KAA0693343.1 hypothetical protein DTW90_26295 [Neorhizobium sp. P12A]
MSYDLAVVGAGFSAIAVTINALLKLPPSGRVAVVGDDPGFGRGAAYRTEFYVHRLNVPAARMSVFADRPDDFLDWLKQKGRDLPGDDFASRNDYGLYLRDRLADLLRDRSHRAKVDFIKAKAMACVEMYPGAVVFHLNNTDMLAAKNVVLCLGVGNARLPLSVAALSPIAKSRIVENPWRLAWLKGVGAHDRVLRGSQNTRALHVDWIVNSTGMERAGIGHSPLLEEMRRLGLVQQDPLGLGIVVDHRSRIIKANGTVDDRIYAVGALTASRFWEITAVPDIRRQAAEVAGEIAARFST